MCDLGSGTVIIALYTYVLSALRSRILDHWKFSSLHSLITTEHCTVS